ncbi:MAG: hypothetical protein J7574_09430 [Flavobacterium sp.]|uniref:hypothetical protein n=1 Tax=Flavobacterium sp. TaxID=239 RepID=UPI001B23FE8A|nr:hypothetical protein [Flavobacterium sp.]MBO9584366.1 hypothetical protein [Flavobacterium sp.]
MNKLYVGIVVLFSIINCKIYSQENLNTKFYNVKIPEKTIVKFFDSTNEELANIDAYQFISDEKPKYLLYLMSNKTNQAIDSVTIDNYKNFLFDLGDLKIGGIEDLDGKIKVSFTYSDNNEIKGIIYVYVINNILNRFVFLYPNQNAKDAFQKETNLLVKNIIEVKKEW